MVDRLELHPVLVHRRFGFARDNKGGEVSFRRRERYKGGPRGGVRGVKIRVAHLERLAKVADHRGGGVFETERGEVVVGGVAKVRGERRRERLYASFPRRDGVGVDGDGGGGGASAGVRGGVRGDVRVRVVVRVVVRGGARELGGVGVEGFEVGEARRVRRGSSRGTIARDGVGKATREAAVGLGAGEERLVERVVNLAVVTLADERGAGGDGRRVGRGCAREGAGRAPARHETTPTSEEDSFQTPRGRERGREHLRRRSARVGRACATRLARTGRA